MAKTDKKDKVERSYERYRSYDLRVWSLEFFDEKTGGFVVVNFGRIEHSKKSKNERKKYEKELAMANVFAKNGYRIEMMNEVSRKYKYDVKINGFSADMKRISGTNNIVKAASKAVGKQNSKIVLFQFDTVAERVYLELVKLVRNGYKILYFFTDEEIVYNLGRATPRQMVSGRGGDTTAPK